MRILLVAVDAKYIHSNLAVYSLKAYAEAYLGAQSGQVQIGEYTINNRMEDILKGIYGAKPDVVAFSCYIWNILLVEEVSRELRKILPEAKIWAGGPEVSHNAREELLRNPQLDGILIGEGEETFLELAAHYIEGKGHLREVKGVAFYEGAEIVETEPRPQLSLDAIPFPYKNMEGLEHRIVYYESSRGCPYSCSYCLSSIDKRLRLRSIELVKRELQHFLDQKVPQVKFVDRTFNCSHGHAMAIWQYIKENDNGVTNFHFEISADLLSDDQVALINSFRPGLAQFEIGIQSILPDTIEAIHRKTSLEKLEARVRQVAAGNNVHQHLDLIAGLPYESYEDFQKSFCFAYGLKPEQLQLGFLKVLKGAAMYEDSKKYGIAFQDSPPYEVLFTKWLSYGELLELKKVEEMVEIYYNSGQFSNTVSYLEHFFESPFLLYHSLGDYYESHGLHAISHSRIRRYEILLDWSQEKEIGEPELMKELMVYDLYLRENLKSRPAFAREDGGEKAQVMELYRKEAWIKELLPHYEAYTWKQISRMTHMEVFHYDLEEAVRDGRKDDKTQILLFDYEKREPLHNQGAVWKIKEEFYGKKDYKSGKAAD